MRASRWTLAVGVPFMFVAAVFARRAPGHLIATALNARHATSPPRVPTSNPNTITTPDYVPVVPAPTVAPSVTRCAMTEPSTDPRDALGIRVRAERSPSGGEPRLSYGENYRAWLRVPGLTAPMVPTAGPDARLTLTLAAPASLTVRAPIALTLTAENAGTTSFAILRTNDGSFERMREPHVELYLQRASDNAVFRLSAVGGRCGNTNSVERADIIAMPPHSTNHAAFAQWATHLVEATIPVRGHYKLWVMYRLCDREQVGQLTEGVVLPAELLNDRVVSNVVEIDVR